MSSLWKIVLTFVAALLLISGLVSCAKAPEPALTPEVIVLRFACDTSAAAPYSLGQEWYMAEVEKRTDGRVEFERYWAQSLAPSSEQLDAVSTGIADITALVVGYWPGKLPLSNVATMPGLNWDLWPVLKAAHDLYELPEIKAEYDKLNIVVPALVGTSNYRILSKEPIQGLDDLKGKKSRVMGLQAELFKALGGVPVSMAAPEVFDALDRGTLDAVYAPPSFITAFGFHEVAKYYSNLGVGSGGAWAMAVNMHIIPKPEKTQGKNSNS